MNNPYAAYSNPAAFGDANMQYMQQMQELQLQQMYAAQVQTMQAAPAPTTPAHNGVIGSRRYTGRVKSFFTGNGYGFLTSPEITSIFSMDIFLHQLEVDKITGVAGTSIPVGTTVSFAVVPNKKGQPQARDLAFEYATIPQMPLAGQSLTPPLPQSMTPHMPPSMTTPITPNLQTPVTPNLPNPMLSMMYPMPGMTPHPATGSIPPIQPAFSYDVPVTTMLPQMGFPGISTGLAPTFPPTVVRHKHVEEYPLDPVEDTTRSRSRSPRNNVTFPNHID